MKLFKTLFLLSLSLMSCSSNDNDSDDNNDIDTQVQISFSGDDIQTSTFDSTNLNLAQQCEILELRTNTTLQNESINVSDFLLQFGNVQNFQELNPDALYSYNGENANLIGAQLEINSEIYVSTSLAFQISSESFNQEGGCAVANAYWGQIFEINFTIVLESSNSTLSPITVTGTITDFPIDQFACGC